MSDAETVFERIINGEIPAQVVYQDERTFAFRDVNPQAEVHVLVVPRVRYRNLAELAEADGGLLADVVKACRRVAEIEGIAESGYRVVFNTDGDAGQTVFHVHAHVLGGEPLGSFGRS
ncbi:histidine triad nucleotide-binding protein [Amycolatopsis sp. PS_44_ISF1]|uniref:histidine triad nucleotide-binding protein n=1 Tax=Amycolatopsis sp. PS_44_ISF1 TaxID=2974917 RepID=UPI0028DF91A1|nr:histidine triad nucleotide-binding protein [Amycolatopsis sp. PS_44_ISF1]MDT8914620.1 histidine triad nucleotide-binding protein [Amycolatopsis sp. PS_44_ISF1]